MELPLLEKLAEYGAPAIILGIVFWMYWRKDEQLQQCNKERVEDNKEYLKVLSDFRATLKERIAADDQRNSAMAAVAQVIQAQAPILARLERLLERSGP